MFRPRSPTHPISSPLPALLALYAAGVAARFAACLLVSQNPFVLPDEAVYANIARSLWQGTGVTLRGQPLTYTNLLYPLLIAPAWASALPWSPFRAVQLVNCLLMNLAVFPAWFIARDVTGSRRAAWAVAVFSLLMPDMLLTSRVMAEPLSYPLLLLTALLMFRLVAGQSGGAGRALVTAACAFLLAQAKGGYAVLAVACGVLLLWTAFRSRSREEWITALCFLGGYAALTLLARLAIGLLPGVDYTSPTIYQTETQLPTAEHLKRTLPGLLLYLYFVPVAFGVYPLLLPAAALRRYDEPRRRQLLLTLASLAAVAAGACYMFHSAGTAGDPFAGRVHLRYLFPFLPLLLAFLLSPALDGVRPGAALKAMLGFLLAMTVTVSFSALLSSRRYPVDAILLSSVIYDDPQLNFRLLSQIAAVTFTAAMLAVLIARGWGRPAKALMGGALMLSLLLNNWLGYDLNRWNDSPALAGDAAQAAHMLENGPALLVPDGGLYFDNDLSVLDCAMKEAPRFALLEDLCGQLGPYGRFAPFTPPQYWTENPAGSLCRPAAVALNMGAFHRLVPAAGVRVAATDNGYFGILTPTADGRLFHSALAAVAQDGAPGPGAALYVYDETLLKQGKVRVYLQVRARQAAGLTLSAGEVSYPFELNGTSDWIYADFAVPAGDGRLKVSITTNSSDVKILTYQVQQQPALHLPS